MDRVTREQFRGIVRQVLAQKVTPLEVFTEAMAEYAAFEASDEIPEVDGNTFTPGGGGFGGGGASGNW